LLLLIELYARYILGLVEHDFIGEIVDVFELASLIAISPWDSALTQFVLKGSGHLAHPNAGYSCWWWIYIDSHNGSS
jgi:hypothetical protein